MSCCNQCLEWAASEDKNKGKSPQGHHMCYPPTEEDLELFKKGNRPDFDGIRWTITRSTCVCDFQNPGLISATERAAAEGHINEVGGYCCPHHGNTCGYCHHYKISRVNNDKT